MDRTRPLGHLLAFILLGRPHFLVGGFVLHALGAAIALYQGVSFDPTVYLWGQIAITATQLMTHYANDYFDLEADLANQHRTRWAGGSGVLPDGRLPAHVALVTAGVLGTVALVSALILAFLAETGPLSLPLLLMSISLAWFYSAPPVRLHSTGFGEFTTAILVPVLVPLAGFYLQAGKLDALPLLATMPLAMFQFAMLLVIEFPDAEGDRKVGKRTLVVRAGAELAAKLYVVSLITAYVSLPPLVLVGLPIAVAGGIVSLSPLAGWQVLRMSRGDWQNPQQWDRLAFVSIALLVSTSLVELLIFIGLAAST